MPLRGAKLHASAGCGDVAIPNNSQGSKLAWSDARDCHARFARNDTRYKTPRGVHCRTKSGEANGHSAFDSCSRCYGTGGHKCESVEMIFERASSLPFASIAATWK